jgi:hypothetical protein
MSYDEKQLGEYMAAFGETPRWRGPRFGLGSASTPTPAATPAPAPTLKMTSIADAARQGLYPPDVLERQPVGSLVMIPTSALQTMLNVISRTSTPLKSGKLDSSTLTAWTNYTLMYPGESVEKTYIGAGESRFKDAAGRPQVTTRSDVVFARPTALNRLFQRAQTMAAAPAPTAAPKTTTAPRTATQSRETPVGGDPISRAPMTLPAGFVWIPTLDVQKILVVLGAKITADGKFGPNTAAAWKNLTQTMRMRVGGSDTGYYSGDSYGALGSKSMGVHETMWEDAQRNAADKKSGLTDREKRGATQELSTADAQSILKNLGAADKALNDGKYGPTTARLWGESATKRGLNPVMEKASADGTKVYVSPETWLKLRADADAKGAPPPAPVVAMQVVVPREQVEDAVARLGGVPAGESLTDDQIIGLWAKLATAVKLAADIKRAREGFEVNDGTWKNIAYAASQTQRPPAQARKSDIELATAQVLKQASTSVPVTTVQTALNAAIQKGTLKMAPFTEPLWVASMVGPLVAMSQPADAVWKAAWEQSLVQGKLVSADRKSVKLLPAVASALSQLAAQYAAEKKQGEELFKGYTEVNAAEVIARINNLGVTTKKFDKSGGAKELADAVRTFFEETKTKLPSGDLVKIDSKQKTYLKNETLAAMAAAATAAQQRADATKRFRDSMVANALKEASAQMTVLSFQEAVKHAVLSGAKVSNKKLYESVATSNVFDKQTREVYTDLARTLTIGPAVLEYERLLKSQLGPAFKVGLVEEARNQVWNSFLDAAVVKTNDGKFVIRMLPALAKQFEPLAALYRKNVSAEKKSEEQWAAFNKALADAVKKSTVTLSMLNVQQGLLEAIAGKDIQKVSGLKLTGTSDGPTREALFHFNGLIFPEGMQVPETGWAKYLAAVGYIVTPGQPVKRAWVGANYIALPRALADHLAKLAGEWILKNGQSQIRVAVFNDPSVITVKVPKQQERDIDFNKAEQKKAVEEKKPVYRTGDKTQAEAEAKAAAAKKAAEEQAAREAAARAAQEAAHRAALAAQQAENERRLKEQAAAAALAAQQAEREARLREQAARDAGAREAAERAAAEALQAAARANQLAEDARAAAAREAAARQEQASQIQTANQAATEATLPLPPPSTPELPAPVPEPMPVVQAGMGAGSWLAMLAAGTAAYFLTRKDEQGGGGVDSDQRY